MQYPWQYLDPKDHIQIQLHEVITDMDTHILSTLYKPLLGGQATSLYLTLRSALYLTPLATYDTLRSRLLAEMNVGIQLFYEAQTKLEALGLLTVLKHKTQKGHYIYRVNRPLSARNFFEDSILRTLLYQQVGERHYKHIKSDMLMESNVDESYEDITHSFLDVYHYSGQLLEEDNTHTQLTANTPIRQQVERESQFDWDFFKQGLSQHFVKGSSITEDVKYLIDSFHVAFGIGEREMQSLVLESADIETGVVQSERLEKVLNAFVQQMTPTANTRKETNTDEADESAKVSYKKLKAEGFSETSIESILSAYSFSPLDYLNSVKKRQKGFVTSSEKWVIKELVTQSALPAAVINILLSYILVIKNNPTLEKNYTLKIANDWAQKGVHTPEQAMTLVKDLYREQTKEYKRKHHSYRAASMKRETLPEWVTDPIQAEDKMTPAKEKEIRKKLEQMRQSGEGE